MTLSNICIFYWIKTSLDTDSSISVFAQISYRHNHRVSVLFNSTLRQKYLRVCYFYSANLFRPKTLLEPVPIMWRLDCCSKKKTQTESIVTLNQDLKLN